MNINLKIDKQHLNLDAMIALSENVRAMKLSEFKAIMVSCMTDDKGEFLPQEQAEKIAGRMLLSEIEEAAKKFRDAVTAWQNEVVPPLNNGNSQSLDSTVEPPPTGA
jgi:hypothetical protein